MKIRPLGHKKMAALYARGQMFYDGMATNQRLAHCKVCGCDIQAEQGERWFKFGPNNDFHFQVNYLCPSCNAYWAIQDAASLFEITKIYSHSVEGLVSLAKQYSDLYCPRSA